MQFDYTTINDARADCERYIRENGFVLPRTGWTDRGYGDKGDRHFTARLLTDKRQDSAIYAHFYDGSVSGEPFCHFAGEFGKYSLDDWKPAGKRGSVPVKQFTPEEIAAMAERDRKQAEQERSARQEAFAADLEAFFFDALPLDKADPNGEGLVYLRKKRVPLDTLPNVRAAIHSRDRLPPSTSTGEPRGPYIPAGALIVPFSDVRDLERKIVAFQWIKDRKTDDDGPPLPYGNGKAKRFRKDAKPKTLFKIVHWIGDPRGAAVVALAEGLATAATWYQLTGIPTGSTCDADQLEKTGKALLSAFPAVRVIVVTDDDFMKDKTGLTAAKKIQDAAPRRVYIALPPWPRHEMIQAGLFGKTDWNDYFCLLADLYGEQGEQIARQAAEKVKAGANRHFNEVKQ